MSFIGTFDVLSINTADDEIAMHYVKCMKQNKFIKGIFIKLIH